MHFLVLGGAKSRLYELLKSAVKGNRSALPGIVRLSRLKMWI